RRLTDHCLGETLPCDSGADERGERFAFGQKIAGKREQISDANDRVNDSERCDLKHPKWRETTASHNSIDKQIRRGADKCDRAAEDGEGRKRNKKTRCF